MTLSDMMNGEPRKSRFVFTMLMIRVLAFVFVVAFLADISIWGVLCFETKTLQALQFNQITLMSIGFFVAKAGDALSRWFKSQEDEDRASVASHNQEANPPTN